MNQKTVIITLVLGLIALLLLLAVGNSAKISTNVSGTATDDCRSLCQESCQGFASAAETDLCRGECQTMCAESY